MIIYSIAYSEADSKPKPPGREVYKTLFKLTLKFFLFQQLFSALGVDLRPGNDTIKYISKKLPGGCCAFLQAGAPCGKKAEWGIV